jgi:methyl-accepting chemotaxis protein
VNQALTDLNRIVQQNAAASEELACSAEELAGQAEQLKSIISFFKIREDH